MAKKHWTITADKFLNREQTNQLVSFLEDHRDLGIARQNLKPQFDYYIVMTLLQTGLRCFEFCQLKNSDIQGSKLIVKNGKGNKPRTVLLTRNTSKLLRDCLTLKQELQISTNSNSPFIPNRYGDHFSTRGVRSRVKNVFKKVGLPNQFSVHSLRHTYCSLLLETKKASLSLIRNNMGHGSLAVVNMYSHALSSLEDLDLFDRSISENLEKSEATGSQSTVNTRSQVKAYSRKRKENDKKLEL